MSFFGFDTTLPEDENSGLGGELEAAYDAKNDDTFGDVGGSGLASVLSSALDAVLDGGDGGGDLSTFGGLEYSMMRLTEDDEKEDGGDADAFGRRAASAGDGLSAPPPVALFGSDELITPDMLLKPHTTTVHGKSTASIWGAPAMAPVVSAPPAAPSQPRERQQQQQQQAVPAKSMTLAELEAQLMGLTVAPAPPPGLTRAPKPTAAPTTSKVAPVPTSEARLGADAGATSAPSVAETTATTARVPEERATAAWSKPDEGGAESSVKETPILRQLQQQRDQHVFTQKRMAEQQRFDTEMKQLGREIETSRVALSQHQGVIHSIRTQLQQLGPNGPPAKIQELRQAEHAQVGAANEQRRRLDSLEHMCVAAQRRFEKFNLDLAIEAGHAEEHRAALLESVRVKSELLRQKSNGLHQLGLQIQRHQAMLQQEAARSPPNPQAILELQRTIGMWTHEHVANQKHCQVIAGEIAFQTSLLDLLPLSAEAEESKQYNNLMSESEKRWLVKIQAKQMHSDDPYVDDFYAHTLVRRRAAAMRAAMVARGGVAPGHLPPPMLAQGPMPMGKHRREKVEQARAENKPYNPVQFDKTLGSIKGTSIRAPKPLIEIPKIPADLHTDHTGAEGDAQSRELIERARRRKALISIEHAYREMLLAEDRAVKLEQPGMSVRARQQIEAERHDHLSNALGYFQVVPADKEWAAGDDNQFWRLTAVEKGRKLFARLIAQLSDQAQAEAVLLLLIRNMGTMVLPRSGGVQQKEEHLAMLRSVLALYPGAVAQLVSRVGMEVLVSCFRTVNQVHAAAAAHGGENMDPFHKFCVLIIYTICRRADALLSSGSVPIELQHEWSHNVESLVVKSAKQLADKVVEAKTNGLYLWEFANILASHSSPAGKATLRAALLDIGKAMKPHASLLLFDKITAPPEPQAEAEAAQVDES